MSAELATALSDVRNSISKWFVNLEIQKSKQTAYCAMAFARILDLSEYIIDDIEKSRYGTVPLIYRPMYEVYVNLRFVAINDANVDYIIRDHFRTRKQIYDYARRSPQSPYHRSLLEHSEFDSRQQEIECELQKFEQKGIKGNITLEEKHKRARMDDEYRSVYWLISEECHSSLQSMESTHLVETGKGIEIRYGVSKSQDDIMACASGTVELLQTGARVLAELPDAKSTSLAPVTRACDDFYRQFSATIKM